MLMIRLARFGAKKKPVYRVVVIEKTRARNSEAVEILGHYNPITEPAQVVLHHDRLDYWLSKGAQMSETVERLRKLNPAPAPVPEAVAS